MCIRDSPSKVDRSAAYAARHIAKNMVAAGVADEMLVQVSYAIGVAKPMNIFVNTFGRAKVNMTDGEIAAKIWDIFDMRPKAIEERLKLRNPIYLDVYKRQVLVDPARKIRIGNKLYFGEDDSMVAEVIDNTTSRGRTLRFLYDGNHDEFKKALYALGETPLPKYIEREVEPEDEDRYQNIFAAEEGAVVAPAAGLHFSRELMKRLEIKDCQFAFLTLHSGLGNFREIDVEDLTKHKMDSEQMVVNADVVDIVNKGKDEGHKVCAVGTSVMRAIETAVSTDGHLKEFEGWTNKFIFPPYDFSVATSMVTNFHMPLSTLLMMTASFGGYELIMDAYDIALKEKYRFRCV